MSDYTLTSKGIIAGRRTLAALQQAGTGRLVEKLSNEFRCVSVDLLARRIAVHRRGLLADAVGCSLHVHGLFAPIICEGTLHVGGAVLWTTCL